MERVAADEFTLNGRLSLHDVRDLTGLTLESVDVGTLGGYVTEQLGHLPQLGETIQLGPYLITVAKSDGRRVRQLHFKRKPVAQR